MAIDSHCANEDCGAELTVGDELADKKTKCPKCQTILAPQESSGTFVLLNRPNTAQLRPLPKLSRGNSDESEGAPAVSQRARWVARDVPMTGLRACSTARSS